MHKVLIDKSSPKDKSLKANIIYKALIIGQTQISGVNGLECCYFSSLNEIDDVNQWDLIVFTDEQQVSLEIVAKLRTQKVFLKPLVSYGFNNHYLNFSCNDFEDLNEQLQVVLDKYQKLEELDHAKGDNLIIKYLYLYSTIEIVPIKALTANRYFSYPIIDIFNSDFSTFTSVINELDNYGLIASKVYLDKCFSCNSCGSELIRFIERCPACHSSDIQDTRFIHCFKCGHVANENKFFHTKGLVCPNCNKPLRLIGDDYDRPIENNECNNCGEIFIDPEVSAECGTCHETINDIAQLEKRYYHSYKLVHDKDELFLSIATGGIFSLFNKLNFTSQEYFANIVDWLVKLTLRHHEEKFSIIELNFNHMINNLDMKSLANQLKNSLRTTDFYCNLNSSWILILLPKTDKDECKPIANRIQEAIKQNLRGSDNPITLDYYSPKDIIESKLMSRWFKL